MKFSKIALFHSNNCIHCTRFQPTWNEISQRLGANECPGIACESYKDNEIPESENITGYPTIRLYGGDGQKYEWYGPRDASIILSLLKGKLPKNREEKWVQLVKETKPEPEPEPEQSGGKRKTIPKYRDNEDDSEEDNVQLDDDLKFKIKYMKYKAKYFRLRDKLAQKGGWGLPTLPPSKGLVDSWGASSDE